MWGAILILFVFLGLARVFSPNPVRKSPLRKLAFLIKNFSFRTKSVQEKDYFGALGENLSSP